MSPPRTAGRLDLTLLRLARTVGHPVWVERLVRRYSQLGAHGGLWLVIGSAGMAADGPRRAAWRHATKAVLRAYAVNQAIKILVRRRRPVLSGLPPLVGTRTSLSFPSAHAATSFAAAGAFAPLVGCRAAATLHLAAAAMACSRVYLGVHHPSDVAAGAALGAVVGGASR